MTSEIVDLDAVVGPPKKVRLKKGGPVYTLPADLPVELYLRLNAAAKTEVEQDSVETLYEQLLELFREHQPTLKKLPIGMKQLVLALPTIYGDGDTGESEGKAPSRTASRGTSSSRKRSNASRS